MASEQDKKIARLEKKIQRLSDVLVTLAAWIAQSAGPLSFDNVVELEALVKKAVRDE